MSWDEAIVYVLGCLALEQSRDIAMLPRRRKELKLYGWACILEARSARDVRAVITTPGSYSC